MVQKKQIYCIFHFKTLQIESKLCLVMTSSTFSENINFASEKTKEYFAFVISFQSLQSRKRFVIALIFLIEQEISTLLSDCADYMHFFKSSRFISL